MKKRDRLYDTTNLLLIFLFFWEEENIIEQFLNFNTIITLFYNCCVRGINDKCVQWVNRIRFIRTLWTIRWKCSFKYEIRIFDGELLNAVTFIQHIPISDFIIAPKRTKLPINRRNEILLRSPPPRKFIQIVSSIIPWKLLLNMTAIQRYFVILFNNTFLTIPMKLRTKMLNRRSFLNGLILISENREKSGSKKELMSNTFDSILQSTFLFNIHIPF